MFGMVKDGKLKNINRKRLASELAIFEGKNIKLTIELKKSNRSLEQNKYWWVLMGILGSSLGYSKEEIHELMKFKFLKREKVIETTGEILPYIASTTSLNKSDFADMISQMQQWSAEMGIRLPDAGEQLKAL